MTIRMRGLLLAGCLLGWGASALPLSAQQIAVNKNNRTIAISTSAEATAEADTAVVHIGFLVYGPGRESAYANGSKTSNAIAQALRAAGVPQDAVQSENQSIAPVEQYGSQNWTAEEKAERKFEVRQSWIVKTAARDAARILDVAVKAGANQSGQIEWSVADPDALEAKAAGLALKRAQAIAQQMAKGLNTTLGPLLYASNQALERPIQPLLRTAQPMAAMQGAAGGIAPLSISARKVTRSATVYAVFAMQ